jgi:tRNA pseudouridine55 synthase
VIYIYKNLGETPLEALNRLRIEKPEYKDAKLSYAGRLDPMAEGVMLVMVGEENREREKYLNMEKEYEFEVLFGFSTDTFDLLGLVIDFSKEDIAIGEEEIANALRDFKGKRNQTYPAYSSKTVAGKPMFEYAREGKLGEIDMPTKEIEILNIELLGMSKISKVDLVISLAEKIGRVKGDFRQQEILQRWGDVLVSTSASEFTIAKIRMHCTSGTYARSVAAELGQVLGFPALAFSIKRVAYK